MKSIGTVINNNLTGFQFLVEGPANTTVPVGTEVFCAANEGAMPLPGTFVEESGGFFSSVVQIDGRRYKIFNAPKSQGEFEGSWGKEGKDVAGARSVVDGRTNTKAMAEAGSAIAQKALASVINGKSDWYIPARDEMEPNYRHLKPGTDENLCGFRDGDNPSSLPPGLPYTETSPAQTTLEAYKADGPEAFEERYYHTSTQYSAYCAFVQDFSGGDQTSFTKVFDRPVRLVRRELID